MNMIRIILFSLLSFFIYPSSIAAILPDADLARPIYFDESSSSALLSIEPFTIVNATILPFEDSCALALIIDEVSLVLFAVGPFENSIAMHFVLVPFA